jgi:hypothetical protein
MQIVPLPVLFGVFLYMGYASLDQQLIDRLLLVFTPVKRQPDTVYIRLVRIGRIHAFTLVQCVCVAILCVVKYVTVTKMFFPLMVRTAKVVKHTPT